MARILVVDDEESLQALLRRFLERQGHVVGTASNAAEALAAFAQDAYDLAVVDLSLPDQPGDELAVKLAAGHAGLRLILFSGHPFQIESLPPALLPRARFLAKPFPAKALTELVSELLS